MDSQSIRGADEDLKQLSRSLAELGRSLHDTLDPSQTRGMATDVGQLGRNLSKLIQPLRDVIRAETDRATSLQKLAKEYEQSNEKLRKLAASGPLGFVKALFGAIKQATTGTPYGAKKAASVSDGPADILKKTGPSSSPHRTNAKATGAVSSPLASAAGPGDAKKAPSKLAGGAASVSDGGVGGGMGGAAAMAGPYGAIAAVALEGAKQLKDGIKKLVAALMDPSTQLAQAVAPFINQVQQFDPGLVERFNMALEDLSAAVGSAFGPAIEAALTFANELNVVYTALASSFRPLIEAVSQAALAFGEQLLAPMMEIGQGIAAALEPFIGLLSELTQGVGSDLADMFRDLSPIIAEMAKQVAAVVGVLLMLARAVIQVQRVLWRIASFGLIGGGSSSEGSAAPTGPTTVAARAARNTSIANVGQEARRAAFGAATIQQQQLAALTQIQANTGVTAANTAPGAPPVAAAPP